VVEVNGLCTRVHWIARCATRGNGQRIAVLGSQYLSFRSHAMSVVLPLAQDGTLMGLSM
jgi:hypothetical protein